MEQRNYYAVLGVSQSEAPSGIRRAFRDLALRYHPDRAGPATTHAFQDIVQAYEVLSDPTQRAQYDRERTLQPRTELQVRSRSAKGSGFIAAPLSLMRDFEVTWPPFEDIFDQFFRSMAESWASKSGRGQALDLELILSPTEAATGGIIRLLVPAFRPCAACHGTGRQVDSYYCRRCGGSGMIQMEEMVRVSIPSELHSGTTLTVPLREAGMAELYLRILLRVH